MASNQCNSVACVFGAVVRTITGIIFLFAGALMSLTFWLLPVGVPLGLLGMAILVSDVHHGN